MVVYEASVKTSTNVAIAVLISLGSMVILSDMHKIFMNELDSKLKKKKVTENINHKNKNHTNKVIRLHYIPYILFMQY